MQQWPIFFEASQALSTISSVSDFIRGSIGHGLAEIVISDFSSINYLTYSDTNIYRLLGLMLFGKFNRDSGSLAVDMDRLKQVIVASVNCSKNPIFKQRNICEPFYPDVGDLVWDQKRVDAEYELIKTQGLAACRDCVGGMMDEDYAVATHKDLRRMRGLDDWSVLNKAIKVNKNNLYSGFGFGGNLCVMRTCKLGCAYQVMCCACMLFNVMPDLFIYDWLRIMLNCHLLCGLNKDDYIAIGKKMTVLAKKGRDMFTSGWFCLIDLNTWAGYNVGVKLEDEVERQVPEWVKGELVVQNCDRGLWKECQLRMMKQLFVPINEGKVDAANRKSVSFHSWVSNPDNWVTPGASGIKGSVLLERSRTYAKTKGNKCNVANTLTTEEIMERIFDEERRIELKPAVKVELGWKNRLIIRVDDFLNICSSFSGRYCMWLLKGSKYSTLFMDSHQMYNMWLDWSKLLKGDRVLSYPYDAPQFDQRVQTDEMRNYFLWKEWLVGKFKIDGASEMEETVRLSQRMYFRQVATVGGDEIKLEHGMVSGFFDTALGDTVVSVSRNFVLMKSIDALLRYDDGVKIEPVGQGDDFCTLSSNLVKVMMHFDFVNKCGWGAHVEKNLIAVRYTEFLRKFCDGKRVSGYLSRKVGGLLFRDPIKRGDALGLAGMREKVGALNVLITRGASRDKVMPLIKKRMSAVLLRNRTYMPNDLAYAASTTPGSYDGGGIWIVGEFNVNKWIAVEDMLKNEPHVNVDVPVVGGVYRQMIDKVEGLVGATISKTAFENQMVDQMLDQKGRMELLAYRQLVYKPMAVVKTIDRMVRAPDRRDVIPSWVCDLEFMRSIAQDALIWCLTHQKPSYVDNFVDNQSAVLIKSLNVRWKRSMVLDWLNGKLRPRSPLLVGYSPIEVSIVSNLFISSFYNDLLNKRSVSVNELKACSANIEYSVVKSLMCNLLPMNYSD
nr:TPA_asm: hypothetical protein [Denlac tricladivirus]